MILLKAVFSCEIFLLQSGFDIHPGAMASIKMNMVETSYLDEPYGRCSEHDKRAPDK